MFCVVFPKDFVPFVNVICYNKFILKSKGVGSHEVHY